MVTHPCNAAASAYKPTREAKPVVTHRFKRIQQRREFVEKQRFIDSRSLRASGHF
jgi:hypothetical protein